MKAVSDEKHLLRMGFFKEFPDEVDKEYFYYRKNIPSKLFKDLHIIIEGKINVYCEDVSLCGIGCCLIVSQKYSFEKVCNIVNIFSVFKTK